MKKQVNHGKSTLFWLDDRSGNGSFKAAFPTLDSLEKKNSCLVADRISNGDIKWD